MLFQKLNFIKIFSVIFFIFISVSLSAQTPQPPAKTESDKDLTFTAKKTPTPAPKENLIIYLRRHALCIGINDYESINIPDLQYAENDAKEVANILKELYGFDDIVILLGKDATKRKIETAIGKFQSKKNIGEKDCVVIFFSGHGQTVSAGKRDDGYIIPQDAMINLDEISDPAPYRRDCIRMEDLKTDLQSVPALHTLFLADSCYSGYFAQKSIENSPDIAGALKYSACQIITTGAKGEKTIESNAWCHGALTIKFIEILKAESEPLRASKLGAMLKERIPRAIASVDPTRILTPQANYLSGEGDFIFIRKDFKEEDFNKILKTTTVSPPLTPPVTPNLPPPMEKSNVDARRALDELLQSFKDRNIPLDKQIVYLQDFISDWKGTGAANNAEGEINRVREIERLTEEAKKEYDGLLTKEEIEVLTKSQADVRKQLWEDYIKKYKDTDYQIAKAEERKQYWTIWKAVTPTPSPSPTPERPDTGYTEKIDLGQGVILEMVYIRGGDFQMGDNGFDWSKPVHSVTLGDFWIGKYEVTQKQWQAVMGNNPSYFKSDDNLPVEQVSWNECQDFCRKLSEKTGKRFTLPTESQWEYSCRAGSNTRFCFGDSDSGLRDYAWYTSNSDNETHSVGQKNPNQWGLYDMHGNVWEWCQDWYGNYSSGSQMNPKGADTGSSRVLRSGSCFDDASSCRSASRGIYVPSFGNNLLGLRLVRTK